MKTVKLEMRPIYHRTDDRIKAHIFICMLAYHVMWHMQKRLEALFSLDGKGRNRKYSFDYILKSLESIRQENVSFMDIDSTFVTNPSPEQELFLNLLDVSI